MKRRAFIQSSTCLAAASLVDPLWMNAANKNQIGIQLYTLRDSIAKDLVSSLRALSAIGYTLVEGYSAEAGHFFRYEPLEFKKLLNDLGLRMPSTHVLTGRAQPELKSSMANNWQKIVDDMHTFDIEYLVCPWIHAEERKTIDDYKRLAEFLNHKADYAKKASIKFAYHAHDFEFITLEAQTPYDVLLQECDKSLVFFELDLYWVKKGGKDAISYFKKHPGRFPLWHVKDMDASGNSFAEVGQGIIDLKSIFKGAEISGMRYYFVEQDVCKSPPLESVKISYDYLRKMNY